MSFGPSSRPGCCARWLAGEPALRPRLAGLIADETPRAARSLERYGEDGSAVERRLAEGGYTPEQILADWLPPVRGA